MPLYMYVHMHVYLSISVCIYTHAPAQCVYMCAHMCPTEHACVCAHTHVCVIDESWRLMLSSIMGLPDLKPQSSPNHFCPDQSTPTPSRLKTCLGHHFKCQKAILHGLL